MLGAYVKHRSDNLKLCMIGVSAVGKTSFTCAVNDYNIDMSSILIKHPPNNLDEFKFINKAPIYRRSWKSRILRFHLAYFIKSI